MTVKSIEDFVDIISHAKIEQRYLEDLKPEVRAVYEERVAYHKLISRLLENDMIEVIVDPVKEAPNNEEEKEEDEKQPEEEKKEEEEKKKEEKTLYDINFVYRTIEKRLNQHPQNYVAGSFGFKDKIGEGVNTVLHAFYDPSFDTDSITIIRNKTFQCFISKSLAEIDTQPEEFKFEIQDNFLDVRLSADSKAQIF